MKEENLGIPNEVSDALLEISLNLESAAVLLGAFMEELENAAAIEDKNERKTMIAICVSLRWPILRPLGSLIHDCREDLKTLGFAGDEEWWCRNDNE